LFPFGVRFRQRIAEAHHAAYILAVTQTHCMPQLVEDLLMARAVKVAVLAPARSRAKDTTAVPLRKAAIPKTKFSLSA
jgi:hypothetical protein